MDIWVSRSCNTESRIRTVETIMKFAEAQLQHQAIMTRLSLSISGADVDEAQEHREKLDQAIALFGVIIANPDF